MGRLINESELIDIIQGSEELLDFQKDECINCIKACNTAYDPDKVVEQLKECAKWMCGSRKAECPYIGNYEVDCEKCAMLRAIEIVKGGGVDGKEQSQ